MWSSRSSAALGEALDGVVTVDGEYRQVHAQGGPGRHARQVRVDGSRLLGRGGHRGGSEPVFGQRADGVDVGARSVPKPQEGVFGVALLGSGRYLRTVVG